MPVRHFYFCHAARKEIPPFMNFELRSGYKYERRVLRLWKFGLPVDFKFFIRSLSVLSVMPSEFTIVIKYCGEV